MAKGYAAQPKSSGAILKRELLVSTNTYLSLPSDCAPGTILSEVVASSTRQNIVGYSIEHDQQGSPFSGLQAYYDPAWASHSGYTVYSSLRVNNEDVVLSMASTTVGSTPSKNIYKLYNVVNGENLKTVVQQISEQQGSGLYTPNNNAYFGWQSTPNINGLTVSLRVRYTGSANKPSWISASANCSNVKIYVYYY